MTPKCTRLYQQVMLTTSSHTGWQPPSYAFIINSVLVKFDMISNNQWN